VSAPVRVALLGFGNVGRALVEIVAEGGVPVRVVSVTDRSGTVVDENGLDAKRLLAAKLGKGAVSAYGAGYREWSSAEAAARSPADVVVQVTPTDLASCEAAVAEIEAAFSAGRDVVTAAKGALALDPGRLRKLGEQYGRALASSAAVAGAVPVLEVLDGAFRGDKLLHLEGVLNGSTTHILSQLEQGVPFERALAEARAAGILETDPSLDLLGLDAAAKAAILHQRAYGSDLSIKDVQTVGITGLTAKECQGARASGFAVRLVARVSADGARVRPLYVPSESPLAVSGRKNAIRLVFESAGEIALTGAGAGPRETAGAVLSDVLTIARTRKPAGVKARAGPARAAELLTP